METDIKGISQCQSGQENYEIFKSNKKDFFQYDYRTKNGQLFSCAAASLKKCREKKEIWLHNKII